MSHDTMPRTRYYVRPLGFTHLGFLGALAMFTPFFVSQFDLLGIEARKKKQTEEEKKSTPVLSGTTSK